MYELFKLVRLISVKDTVPVTITSYAWQQSGEASLLALACSNGFVVLRYNTSTQEQVVKQLPWPRDHPIISMCFDPTVSWLLIQTENGHIFILPALHIVDPTSQVNQLWKLDDVTIITSLKPHGKPTITLWWQTLDAQQIGITATDQGHIVFLNLITQKVIKDTRVEAHIKNLQLVHDDQQIMTHLLITAKSGQQWKMLLEKRSALVTPPDAELSSLGYDSVDGMSLPVITILTSDVSDDQFYPMKFYQFSRSVHLSPQYAKGRHFISAHCDKNSTYQVYDSNLDHNPLFVYKLPLGSMKVVLTDRIMFAVSKLAGQQKLVVLSNQRAESRDEEHQEFNKEAILQQFEFPPEEKLVDILPKSFPFYWHEKLEEQELKLLGDQEADNKAGSQTDLAGPTNSKVPSALGIVLNSHTVLDGCVIVTNSTVYECRPRISPERLFLDLSITVSDASYAEQLGISLSLDLNFLFEMAADYLLYHGRSKQASRLFHVSKGNPVKRVSSFAKYGFIHEIMPFLQQLLNKNNPDVTAGERKQLSELVLHGLVHRLMLNKCNEEVTHKLSVLLEGHQNPVKRVSSFAKYGFIHEIMPFLQQLLNKNNPDVTAGERKQLSELILHGLVHRLMLNKRNEEVTHKLRSHAISSFTTMIFESMCLKGHQNLVKIVSSFAKYGFIHEIMPFLQQLLNKNNPDVTAGERKQLSELILHGLVHRLMLNKRNEEVTHKLRDFLMSNFDYDDRKALTLLSESGLEMMFVEFAMARGLVFEALQVLSEQGQYTLSQTAIDLLISKGFGVHLAQAASGAFLQCLDTKTLVAIFCQKPQLVAMHADLLLSNLSDLDLDTLLQIAESLDPSKPVLQGYIQRQLHSRRRTSSLTSLTSTAEHGDSARDGSEIDVNRLVQCFFMTVLYLNKRRQEAGEPVNTDFLFTHPEELVQNLRDSFSNSGQHVLPLRPSPVGCGQYHAGVVIRGELYTWGRSELGRLGHSEQSGGQSVLGPCKVSTFSMLQIRVISVSCGLEHSMALTQQGVYGWGSSRFGQVGLGTRHVYTRPMLVEEFTSMNVVSLDCGHYHSLAITDEARVYSWGWGVHGQLGHGDTEEQLVPKLNVALQDHTIVKIAAGYGHSLALNSQGELFAFGCSFFGQLGLGTTTKETRPVKVKTLTEKVITMDTKYFHCVALCKKGRVYQWGSHPHGLRHFVHSQRRARQAGQGTFELADGHLKPRLIDTSYVHGKIKQVICGSFHSCIQTVEGDVYTWGRNIDGQCGNGTRQDVRMPQMVTTINDRHVNHIDTGGEYNVALDSEGQIWVWGRNEYGQLGLTGSDMKMSMKISRPGTTKNIGQNVSEVLVPIHLMVGHQMSGSIRDSFMVAETVDLNSLIVRDDEIEEVAYPLTLPSLQKLGTSLYDRIVIPVVLQSLPSICDSRQLLRHCVDMKDWCLATIINVYHHNYVQAFGYHLMCLRESVQDDADMLCQSIKVLQHYYSLMFDTEGGIKGQQEFAMRNYLYQILYHWEICNLPITDLEICLETFLPEISCFLASMLFRDAKTEKDQSETTKPCLFKPSSVFLRKFSTEFCLKVCSNVFENINSDIETSKPLSNKILQELGEETFDSLATELLEGDKLPYDQLWQDILQNLKKGLSVKQYIDVSHTEIDRLEEQLQYSDENSPLTSSVVFFTCGHYYTEISFKEELGRMEKMLKSGRNNSREAFSILLEYYSREGNLPLACPRCVLGVISNLG